MRELPNQNVEVYVEITVESQRAKAVRVIRGYRTIAYETACLLAASPPWDLEAKITGGASKRGREAESRCNASSSSIGRSFTKSCSWNGGTDFNSLPQVSRNSDFRQLSSGRESC